MAIIGNELGVNYNQSIGRERTSTSGLTETDQSEPVFRRNRVPPLHFGNGGRLDSEFTRYGSITAEPVDDVSNTFHVDLVPQNVLTVKHYSCRSTAYRVGMSEMHERLKLAREKAGFASKAQAAKALGIPASTYAAHENGQNDFDPTQAEAYARKFNVSAPWLLLNQGEMRTSAEADQSIPSPENSPERIERPNASSPVPVSYPTDRIPMLGTAIGGDDGRFVLNGNKVGDALCPPHLVGVPNAYGVFVNGTSMEPRYHPGEAVFVNPHLPVSRGDYVVVQIAGSFEGDDLSGYVKRFVSMNSRELILEQYQDREDINDDAPPIDKRRIKFDRSKVFAVHKIVASGIA